MKSRVSPVPPTSRPLSLAQVHAAAKILRQFYAQGQRSLELRPGRAQYRSRSTDTPEDRSRAERDRQSRHVALAYNEETLEALLTKAAKHDFPITLAHIVRLATVTPTSLRTRIEDAMITSRMSRRELEQRIWLQCGKRGHGHSRKEVDSKESATYAILQHCVAFNSLWEGLHHVKGRRDSWWGQLAKPIRARLVEIRQAVIGLQRQLDDRTGGGTEQ